MICKICSSKISLVKSFYKPLHKEKIFCSKEKFIKKIFKCLNCDHHYINSFDYRKSSFIYKYYYDNLAYGNLKNKFHLVQSLKKNKSSNFFIKNFILKNFKQSKKKKLLDFGSGFGIFPFSIKNNYNVFFYEKNKNCITFSKNYLKLNFFNIKSKEAKNTFDYITCNKVLEHMSILDIKKYLNMFKKILKKSGKLYLELPDAAASKKGYHRQEFFSEHINIFSMKSLIIFIKRCGFEVIKIKSLIEVNNKYTIRIVLKKT